MLVISTQLGNTKPNHLICIQYQFSLPVGNTSYVFVAKRWNPTLFVEKNLDYALRAKTLANLRSEPTPHFMRFMRFVQYGLLRVRNPLTVWYLILATGGIQVLALVVYTVWGKYHVCVIVQCSIVGKILEIQKITLSLYWFSLVSHKRWLVAAQVTWLERSSLESYIYSWQTKGSIKRLL